ISITLASISCSVTVRPPLLLRSPARPRVVDRMRNIADPYIGRQITPASHPDSRGPARARPPRRPGARDAVLVHAGQQRIGVDVQPPGRAVLAEDAVPAGLQGVHDLQ